MKLRILIFFCFLFSRNLTYANCGFYDLSLQQLIHHSTQIVEGKIVSKYSYYNSDNSFIYTTYSLAISKVFQGELIDTISFITEGGEVDNFKVISSVERVFNVGEFGVFFLSKNANNEFELSAANQSVFLLDVITNSFSNSILKFSAGNEGNLEHELEKYIGSSFKTIHQNIDYHKQNKLLASNPFINNISPQNISAGTESILNITGSGFGSQNSGLVFFANADDGGATFNSVLSSNILEWTDTKIVLKVPSKAGSGKVWVKQNNITAISPQTLKINYSRSAVESSSGLFQYETNLVNQSQTGGYLLSFNNLFNENSAAKISFEKALSNWRCAASVNFTLTSNSSIDVRASDNTNIIRFAKKDELKPGILGITYSYFISCSDAYWYVKEFDMVFLDTTLWNFDSTLTSNSKYDFLSVATHELGHAVQLAHVIDNTNLMHFSINKGENKREIDSNSLSCAEVILTDAQKTQICGPTAFKLLNAEVCNDVLFTYYTLQKPLLIPNPASNVLNVDFFIPESTNGNIQLLNSLGQLIAEPLNGLLQQGKNSIIIDIENSNLINGLYFVKFNAMNKSFVSKLIIDK